MAIQFSRAGINRGVEHSTDESKGQKVTESLVKGSKPEVEKRRFEQAVERTRKRRADLLEE